MRYHDINYDEMRECTWQRGEITKFKSFKNLIIQGGFAWFPKETAFGKCPIFTWREPQYAGARATRFRLVWRFLNWKLAIYFIFHESLHA